jgi:hypothetical protein
VVGVNEVDPDGGVPDAGLALARRADLDVLPPEDLGAAGLVHADGFRHGTILDRNNRSSVSRDGQPVADQDTPSDGDCPPPMCQLGHVGK